MRLVLGVPRRSSVSHLDLIFMPQLNLFLTMIGLVKPGDYIGLTKRWKRELDRLKIRLNLSRFMNNILKHTVYVLLHYKFLPKK